MKDWMPLVQSLVWPVLIVGGLILFRSQANELYGVMLERVKAGGSIEVVGLVKLGEQARTTSVAELAADKISIGAIGGRAEVVEKGSMAMLDKLKEQLRESPQRGIDVLLVKDRKPYFGQVLKDYIVSLGVRHVVFEERRKFAGWVSAGVFAAQLDPKREYDYEGLRNREIVGVLDYSVAPDDSAQTVLRKMQELHLGSLPVVDAEQRFLFFADREEILASLISGIIIDEKAIP